MKDKDKYVYALNKYNNDVVWDYIKYVNIKCITTIAQDQKTNGSIYYEVLRVFMK